MKKKKTNKKRVEPAPVCVIQITLYSDHIVRTTGFPNEHDAASELMEKGLRAMNKHFLEMAKQGKLDAFNRETTGLLVPDKRIVVPRPH